MRGSTAFAADLTHHLTQVERHYARLFEDAPELSVASGDLVFTGVADDPATLATLQRAWLSAPGSRSGDRSRLALWPARGGPQRPRAGGADGIDAGAARSLRRIGRRRRRAFRLRRSAGAHARQRRAPVDPALERIVARIVRRRARQRPAAGAGDRVAGRTCSTLRSIRRAASTSTLSFDDEAMGARVETFVSQGQSFEDALNRARDFAAEETFHIGLNLLSGRLDPDRAGRAYSALAQGLIAALLKRVIEAFAAEHGRIRGGRVAVVALGKLGSREMTAASDLDLMLIYDFPADASESDGRKRLGPEALLCAPDAAAHLGPDGADQSGSPVRSRHAAQALRAPGSARDPVRVVQALPAGRGGDLGAHGADPRPLRRRATRASGPTSPRRCDRR